MGKRYVILGLAMAVVLSFFVLLALALRITGGLPASAGVNSEFGEIDIQQKPAPDFDLKLLDDSVMKLSDLKGQVVMVEFLASWCPPCRDEAPVLRKLYTEYKDLGVEFIGISIWDRKGDTAEYQKVFDIEYPIGTDESGTILVDFGVRGIPEKFFIDADGLFAGRFVGPADYSKLKEILDDLINKQY